MALVLSIVTFLIVSCVFLAIWLVMEGAGKQDIVAQRLEAVRQTERRGDVSVEVQLLRDEMLSTVPALNKVLLQWSWATSLKRFMNQAGLNIKPARIILLMGVLGLSTYLVVGYLYRQPVVSIVAAVIAAALPMSVVAYLRSKRLARFEEHLPEGLDLLGRAVRAGHSFSTGLELIAQECTEPIAGEFRTTFEEQNLGLPLRDTLLNLTERVPLVDVRMLVTALLIQKETGGNLAEILDELARVIRERFRIYREVRVKTAQGRLTAGILIALPLLMLAALGALNPDYTKVLFVDKTGQTMLIVAGAMQVVGALILWKIVNIEV